MSPPASENGSALPLRPALREEPASPKSGPTKVVSIAEPESESASPISLLDEYTRPKQFKASMGDKRLTGRPSFQSNSSSRVSLRSQGSVDELMPASDLSTPGQVEGENTGHHGSHIHSKQSHHIHHHDKLFSQVAQWLQSEKAKRAARKSKKRAEEPESNLESTTRRPRTSSQSSDSSAISLEQLQRILEENMSSFGHEQLPLSASLLPRKPSHVHPRRRPSLRKLGGGSSDTEYHDGDVVVPSCDVVLDNSKTMSYSGGTADSSISTVTLSTSKRAEKERKAWSTFKCEIVRLAHTLRLKGWRRVPLERGGEIEVERLSGALTNAVYVVSPPKDLPSESVNGDSKPHSLSPPPRLLLRIYGPQVEHLIDRENELSILRRLSRKHIGPRLLGTFKNGRFEEFYNAQTLKAEDLRVEDTSKQIAKRMRELHDGVDLLDREREEGPFVWRNWDKWVDRCEEVITYLDKEVLSGKKGGKGESWRARGLVCGVEWPKFRAVIEKYRKWLYEYYGEDGVRRHLVFAHNDTQYGNILRLIPEKPTDGSAPSPLLLPQNSHKQLVVIDFEYASANTPGLEFANHFTEWCYNYHDPVKSWACQTKNYPTIAQQTAFVRSYVNHRPQFNPRASATPKMSPLDGMAKGSISEFLLDSRTPGSGASGSSLDLSTAAYDYREEEAQREKELTRKVKALLDETRIWRVANSAQWVAWGIVQAKVPELDPTPQAVSPVLSDVTITEEPESLANVKGKGSEHSDKRPEGLKAEALLAGENVTEVEAEAGEDEDEFDYLAYAQDRAMFFWGDVLGLGIVDKSELPESLLERVKILDY